MDNETPIEREWKIVSELRLLERYSSATEGSVTVTDVSDYILLWWRSSSHHIQGIYYSRFTNKELYESNRFLFIDKKTVMYVLRTRYDRL